MSWSNTYSHTLAIAVDMLTASIFWNDEDVTVSSLCGVALRKGQTTTFLARLGKILNKIQANHCEMAITADKARAAQTITFLSSIPPKV